jgi:hypothetical protein
VLPDLVSYASIDAALQPEGDADSGSLPAEITAFREFVAAREEAGSRARRAYLEGRLLERQGQLVEAAKRFAEVVSLDRSLPEPYLRLGSCLRAAGGAGEAEKTLRAALTSVHLQRYAELWILWIQIAFKDLGRAPREVLDFFPVISSARSLPDSERLRVARDYGADLLGVLQCLVDGEPIRINCGGERYESPQGITWGRDRFFDRGSRPGMQYSGAIAGTEDDPLLQSHRWFPGGEETTGYGVPLPPGRYAVTLYFAEIQPRGFGPWGPRVFDVVVEGAVARQDYEPLAAGFATADAWTTNCQVDDGMLDIRFAPRQGSPMVSALSIRKR